MKARTVEELDALPEHSVVGMKWNVWLKAPTAIGLGSSWFAAGYRQPQDPKSILADGGGKVRVLRVGAK